MDGCRVYSNKHIKFPFSIKEPVTGEDRQLVERFTGEIWSESGAFLEAVRCALIQKCNVQNPDSLYWREIKQHIRIYYNKQQGTQASGDEGKNDKQLSPIYEQAYQSYKVAERAIGECTNKEAYKHLQQSPVSEYDLPAFETWARYVREGRRFYDDNKHTARAERNDKLLKAKDDVSIISQISNRHTKPD